MVYPLVSVCIPTFNGAKYFEEALESLQQQSYQNIEVIISDDNSKDNTLEIAAEYRTRSRFPVRIFKHDPLGIGANWNNCLKQARGEYIKFLFQDDILFNNCIERMMAVMLNDEKILFLACKRKIIAENPNAKWQQNWISKYGDLQKGFSSSRNGFTIVDEGIFKEKDFFKDPYNKIGEPTAILFHKSIIKNTGVFREDLNIVLDVEFYYRVLKHYKITIIEEKLVGFRLHSTQTSKKEAVRHQMEFQVYKEVLWKEFFWRLSKAHQLKLLKWKLGQFFRHS